MEVCVQDYKKVILIHNPLVCIKLCRWEMPDYNHNLYLILLQNSDVGLEIMEFKLVFLICSFNEYYARINPTIFFFLFFFYLFIQKEMSHYQPNCSGLKAIHQCKLGRMNLFNGPTKYHRALKPQFNLELCFLASHIVAV